MASSRYKTLRFTGNGRDYFRIWIVNVFLSIVTLGIYSAWAKVRRNQYFYRHTQLDGARFDYHGDPKVILKGRIVAFLLFAVYVVTGKVDPLIQLLVLGVIMLVMPWLVVRALRFRLHNTSYRGLRLSFHGQTMDAYRSLLLWPIAAFITAGLLWPLAKQRITRYLRENSAYGNVFFKFSAGASRFYYLYAMIFLITLLNFAAAVTVTQLLSSSDAPVVEGDNLNMTSIGAGIVWALVGLAVFVTPYITARMQNLVWNHTTLGDHRFSSAARTHDLFGIMFSNMLFTILTLGLFKPFADIRLVRYRLEHIAVRPDGDLEQFVAGQQSQASATGDEMADMFDMDIAL
ncbi:MAG: YjgN family protein [Methylomonas sp.]